MHAMTVPRFPPRLLSARDEAEGVRTFRFASPPGFAFTPGQFLLLHFADDPKTWRAYSLCSSPAEAAAHFELSVGTVGAFSERLGALEPGAEGGLVARGPFGRWTYDGSPAHAVLVSGGTGVTPFRAMCRLKADRRLPNRLTLLCSAKSPAHLLYRREYDEWRRAGIVVRPSVTRPLGPAESWDGDRGRWTPEKVLAAAADPAAVYYLCGPNAMVHELKAGLTARGVPAERIRVERWGDYAELI